MSDVGAALRAASCEGGGCEIRFRNYLQRCSSQQGANLVKEAFTAKFTCYSKASRMPNSIRMKTQLIRVWSLPKHVSDSVQLADGTGEARTNVMMIKHLGGRIL